MCKRVIVLISISLFSMSLLSGQKRLTRITFKEGTVVDGYAKFLEEGKEIKFFSDKESEPVVYSYVNIEKVEMMKGNAKTIYSYIQVINQGTYKLAELLKEGKVNLYKFSYEEKGWTTTYESPVGTTFSIFTPNGPITINNGPIGGFVSSFYKTVFRDLCVKRQDEEMARYFKDVSIGANFKQLGAYYFQDCPELSKKIKSGKFKLGRLTDIVDYYNNFCG